MAAMKFTKALFAASILTACVQAAPASISTKRYAEPGIVRMPISRQTRSLSKRQNPPIAALANDLADYVYMIEVAVGTPPQTTSLQLDTGSSDTWVFAPSGCADSQCSQPYFDPSQSSTYVPISSGPTFYTGYADGTNVSGNYFTDNIQVANVSVTTLQMGLGTSGNGLSFGIMGLSFDNNEAEYYQSDGSLTYPTIIDTMFTQGLISVHGYSLYLDDISASSGEIIFGGYDPTKYSGDLVDLPIVQGSGNGFYVTWQSLSITDSSGTTTQITDSSLPAAALLDSGNSLIRIPSSFYAQVASYFNVTNNAIDCGIVQQEGCVEFGFDGVSISVPFSELAFPADDTGACQFVFYDGQTETSLGDPFLRSAYVYYELDRGVCAIAQTVFT